MARPTIPIPSGYRSGNLTVIRFHHEQPRSDPTRRHYFYEALCDCGKTIIVRSDALRSQTTTSCNCAKGNGRRTHGMYNAPEYRVWDGIKTRCLKPSSPLYPYYGGRGVTLAPEWRTNFLAFYNEVGPRPSPRHSIDRTDNMRGYEPGNVQWRTSKEQSRNRRSNLNITYQGTTHCVTDWVRILGVTYNAMRWRLDHWPLDRVFANWDGK